MGRVSLEDSLPSSELESFEYTVSLSWEAMLGSMDKIVEREVMEQGQRLRRYIDET